MTDPNQIAAAGAGDGTGDNSNAVAMASLAGQTMVSGQTPINYYSNFVSTLGATVTEVQTENTAQNASVTQLQTQNDALSSVNLNDEAAAMSTLETSYQAASGRCSHQPAQTRMLLGAEPRRSDGGVVDSDEAPSFLQLCWPGSNRARFG